TSGASSVRRSTRQRYEKLIFSDFANSVGEAYSPLSSIDFHRWARASAFTIVLSTTIREPLQGAPSGPTTSFRVPRRWTGSAIRTTRVRPARVSLADEVTRPPDRY